MCLSKLSGGSGGSWSREKVNNVNGGLNGMFVDGNNNVV